MLKAVWIVHMMDLPEPAGSRPRSFEGRFALLRSEQSDLARAYAGGLSDTSGLVYGTPGCLRRASHLDSQLMGIEPVRSAKQRSLYAIGLKLRREPMLVVEPRRLALVFSKLQVESVRAQAGGQKW